MMNVTEEAIRVYSRTELDQVRHPSNNEIELTDPAGYVRRGWP